jgi:hypothetical protein
LKLYLVQWGFHSGLDGGHELDSIWTSEKKAKAYLNKQVKEKKLSPSKKNPSDTYFTDGDYWITLTEVDSDTEYMYAKQ